MSGVERKFIIDKLKLFIEEKEIEEKLDKILASCGITKQDYHSGEEANKILEAMIAEKGFFEFVARNIKAKLLIS